MSAQPKPLMEAVPVLPTWQERDAEALETRADNIQAAIVALERLDGMFEDRDELGTHFSNALNLLEIEESNLRTRASRIRNGRKP